MTAQDSGKGARARSANPGRAGICCHHGTIAAKFISHLTGRGGSGRQPARRRDAAPQDRRRGGFPTACGLLSAAVLLLAAAGWGLAGYANGAVGLGGPRLMVATAEHATGLTINHYAEVGFLGFVQAIDALGGVDIRLPHPVRDPYSGLRLPAGLHHVNGITALEYARDRHSFAASDLARISHQHSLLHSVLGEALSLRTLTDPARLVVLARSLLGAIRVDRGLNVTALADRLRGVSPGRIRFLTVPLARLDYRTPTGQSAVLWDSAAAKRLFARLAAGLPLPSR